MNKKLIFVIVFTVLAASLIFVGFAFAQTAGPQATPQPGYGFGPGMMGGGRGSLMGGGFGMMNRQAYTGTVPFGPGMMVNGATGLMHDPMMNALAEALDLSRADLDARIANGETPYQIALAQGKTQDEFFQIMQAARTIAIEQLVADGDFTQEQANSLRVLNHMRARGGRMMGGNGFAGDCPYFNAQATP
jgi:hypothetical protein